MRKLSVFLSVSFVYTLVLAPCYSKSKSLNCSDGVRYSLEKNCPRYAVISNQHARAALRCGNCS